MGLSNVFRLQGKTSAADACTLHRTKHAGNGSIAIRDDGKICAIGGWDGRYDLFTFPLFESYSWTGYVFTRHERSNLLEH